jgi:hypothetical protein
MQRRTVMRLTFASAVVCLAASVASAQSAAERGRSEALLEAVRYLRQSPMAVQWSPAFQTAGASDVSLFHQRRGGPDSVSASERALARSLAAVTLKGNGWTCQNEKGRDRARCALSEAPFYIQLAEPDVRGDTLVVVVAAFRRDSERPNSPIFLLAEVWVVRTGNRWIGHRIYPGVW